MLKRGLPLILPKSPFLPVKKFPFIIQRFHQTEPSPNSFKELTKKYGRTAIALYVTMSCTTFTIIFASIWNGVDVETEILKVKRWLFQNKEEPVKESEFHTIQSSGWNRIMTTFIVAFGANKLLTPFKMMLTMGLTPRVARWLNRRK